jgi:hypothetical protein
MIKRLPEAQPAKRNRPPTGKPSEQERTDAKARREIVFQDRLYDILFRYQKHGYVANYSGPVAEVGELNCQMAMLFELIRAAALEPPTGGHKREPGEAPGKRGRPKIEKLAA